MIHPLVHIGYHKTASTWLQKHLFGNADFGFESPVHKKKVPDFIVHIHSLDFDPRNCRNQFESGIRNSISRGIVPVISAERLSGNAHCGGYDSKEIGERLANVFPEAKVLIVIREQKSMILSTYKEYVLVGGSNSLTDYLCPPERGRGRMPLFDFSYFNYHSLIEHYMNLFGKDNVLVQTFESFVEDPRVFIRNVVAFCEIEPSDRLDILPYSQKERASLSGVGVSLKRRLNLVFTKDRLNQNVLFPSRKWDRKVTHFIRGLDPHLLSLSKRVDDRLRLTIKDLVSNRYQKSNCVTSGLISQDLNQFGYDTCEGHRSVLHEP